jgi:hypothetical protein
MMTEKNATIGKKSQLRIVTIGMREGNTETLRPGFEKFYLECGISDTKPILIFLHWKHTGLNGKKIM